MSTLRILGRRGDKPLHWDPKDPLSVDQARRAFDAQRADGALAFSVAHPGDEGVSIDTFDPETDEIIVSHPLIGG